MGSFQSCCCKSNVKEPEITTQQPKNYDDQSPKDSKADFERQISWKDLLQDAQKFTQVYENPNDNLQDSCKEEEQLNNEEENNEEYDDFHNLRIFQMHLRMITEQLHILMEMERIRRQEEEERNACPEAIEIHYSCQKQKKCQSFKRNSYFIHYKCLKKAWFYSDCQIKCEGNCPSFSIKEALFDCRNKHILQSNQSNQATILDQKRQLPTNSLLEKYIIETKRLKSQFQLEKITNLDQLSQLIKDSLDHANYSVEEQLNFQKQVFESPCFQKIMLQR